ncbi:MAG: 16S rRNA (adenine(1518)-N(6)/adenine(1519)-N(6)) -dimethyltransferase RsmA [Sphingomonadales bacterium]
MMDDPLPPLREVIRRHQLAAQKALGQNFLLDLNLTGRIARAASPLSDATVLEIGPGPGGLTRALLAAGARHVLAVEMDRRCLPALAEIAAAYPGRLSVHHADALAVDEPGLLASQPPPYQVVANLPYNVATALLVKWLRAEPWPPWWRSLTLMFQREVADRITAQPGTKAYGRLSVLAQWRARTRRLFDLPPQAFTPPPKVTSSVVSLTPQDPVMAVALTDLERVTQAAFGQRRKMLRAALKSLAPAPEALLTAAGLDPQARAESLSVTDFGRLAQAYRGQITNT